MPKWSRVFLFVVAPPLAVAEKGVWAILTTAIAMFVFPFAGHIAAALWLAYAEERPQKHTEPARVRQEDAEQRYIRLADGEWLEVVDTAHEEEQALRRHQ